MGQRLKELRQSRGYSQPQLADLIRLPVGTVRNWEQGRRLPNLRHAAALAVALGVTVDDLVRGVLDLDLDRDDEADD